MYLNWTNSGRTGGKITQPEDFVVKEILSKRYTRFSRSSKGVVESSGQNSLCLLRKRNMTTKEAIEIISKHLGINKKDIGFAGLKDKFAVTEQYVTIRSDIREITSDNLSLTFLGKTDNFMSKGDLAGNEFTITLHSCKTGNLDKKMKEILSKKMPNYFGPQRFGRNGNNHIIGRHIVKRDFAKALFLINEQYKKDYRRLEDVPRERLKFYVNAYQSFLFNSALNEMVKGKKTMESIPIFGAGTKLRKSSRVIHGIVKKEGITPESFLLSELHFSCFGGERNAFIRITGLTYTAEEDRVVLKFTLPKGSYATVLINEIRK